MSDKKKSENLSIDDLTSERLKSTEENISEMENILALMDEIEQMKKGSDIDKLELARLQNTVGGYSRVEIVELIDELKEKRDRTLTDVEKDKKSLEKENKELKSEVDSIKEDITNLTKLFSKQIELNKMDNKADIMDAKKGDERFNAMQQEIERLKSELTVKKESFIPEEAKQIKAGDNTLMLESIYTGLSAEIEELKKSLTEGLNYSYSQKQAIYEDISEQLSNISGFDIKNFEEKLTELSQLKATDLKVLEDKIEKMGQLNNTETIDKFINTITQKVTDNIIEKLSDTLLLGAGTNNVTLDTDMLTDKIAEKITNSAKNNKDDEKLQQLSGEINDLKNQISNLLSNKENSEFGLIDYEIKEYLRNTSPIALKDLLVDARNIKNKALKYIENGNTSKGEEIIEGLKNRLKNTVISGSKAIGDIIALMDNYHVPLAVNRTKLVSLKLLMFKYEQESIIPNTELINDIIRTKRDTFKDSDLTVFDKQTFDEICAEAKGLTLGGSIDENKAEKLKTLKKELMSINLSALFDFDIARLGSEITDTDLLLAEIKSLKKEIKLGVNDKDAEGETSGISELSSLTEELTEIAKLASLEEKPVKKTRGKAKKILRPSIPSSSQQEKVFQPLSIKKNKIKIDKEQNPDSLSNILVKKLAENMASKLGKK